MYLGKESSLGQKGPEVSIPTGTNIYFVYNRAYLEHFVSSACSATNQLHPAESPSCEGGYVSGHIASHIQGLLSFHKMIETPSGHSPFDLCNPQGSKREDTPVETKHRHMMSLMAAYRGM